MKWILFCGVFSFVLFGASCKKRIENDIIGAWKVVPMHKPDTNYYEVWEFSDANILVRRKYVNNIPQNDTVINVFGISSKLENIFVNIELREDQVFAPTTDQEGLYRVDRLKSGIMHLTRTEFPDGSTEFVFLRREFVKFSPPGE